MKIFLLVLLNYISFIYSAMFAFAGNMPPALISQNPLCQKSISAMCVKTLQVIVACCS